MFKNIIMALAVTGLVACAGQPGFDPASTPDAGDRVERVEPLSWWVGMKTPLQLMVGGKDISSFNVTVEGGSGVKVREIHKADSHDYIFVDVAIASDAVPGQYWLVFSDGRESEQGRF